MRISPAVLLAGALFATAAHAREEAPPYRDDRSDAASLIGSYYNAINRHEYARAWSYWGEKGPGTPYDAFAAGFADARHVDLATGDPRAEGAAGSVYVSLPVAIASHGPDGAVTTYAGCYVVRKVEPQIQEPPFVPLHISSGSLKKVEGPYEESVPKDCPAQ